MSETHDAPAAAAGSSAAGPEQAAAPGDRTLSPTLPGDPRVRSGAGRAGWGPVAIGLAGGLPLVVALVATAPIWAPLLPWGAGPTGNDTAVGPRIDRVEAPQEQREPQSQPAEAKANAALQRLDQRVGALEARPTAAASDIAEIRQLVARLAGTAADQATRVDAIDKAVRSQTAVDPTDIALVLALLQIRDAVEAGRPFAPAYEALAALARARPEIAAAAAPLAEPAKTGVAGRPVLANRLRELAGAIATGNAPGSAAASTPSDAPKNADAAASDWADQAWRRLRDLVTIRRIDSAGQGQLGVGQGAAVNAALSALAGGDLEGAVGGLEALTGAPAEAARPWLRMAKERLAVEAALQRIEALLVARLGSPSNASAGAGPPR